MLCYALLFLLCSNSNSTSSSNSILFYTILFYLSIYLFICMYEYFV